ncbi:poly(R)-hydroxyalkanoic acid synthase subunit PhaE [Salinirubellus sp. GCM10025818]|uniref:poly(R)-hydroxyalkanoic acid synthase subunit PhaE n=1 Tax=Salinirubellus TaxID=2162630 RepID=UPI0030CE7C42
MSETPNEMQEVQEQWARMVEQMNDTMSRSIEQNMEAQASLMESWADAMNDSVPDEEMMAENFEGYARAYEVWIDAAEQLFERTADAAEGEDVSFTELRDVWLQSANQAFKEVMSTSAFAAANGQLVDTMMEMQTQTEEFSEETLAQLGLPTQGDVEEVGERLIELERRQHAVEEKLDRVLEHLEE